MGDGGLPSLDGAPVGRLLPGKRAEGGSTYERKRLPLPLLFPPRRGPAGFVAPVCELTVPTRVRGPQEHLWAWFPFYT